MRTFCTAIEDGAHCLKAMLLVTAALFGTLLPRESWPTIVDAWDAQLAAVLDELANDPAPLSVI